MIDAYVFRFRSGGAVLDDGGQAIPFDHWRSAVAEAEARGLRVPPGVPPFLPPIADQGSAGPG